MGVPMFDRSAFADTLNQIRRTLDDVDTATAWLYPCAYEQRSGGGNNRPTTCSDCGGKGVMANGEPCNTCVVAVIGDAGEIVVRRSTAATILEQLGTDAERLWTIGNRMADTVARFAKLIDAAASTDERWGPPTVDWREVEQQWAAKRRRVARGGDQPAAKAVERDAQETLARHRKQQEAVRAAAAARQQEAGKRKIRNKWEGAR